MGETLLNLLGFVLALWGAWHIGFRQGYEQGSKIPYERVSKAARAWIEEGQETIKRKWSDCE